MSHSTTSYDLTPEGGTRYSVSQRHIVRPGDRERHTLQCLTAPHRTTGGQRWVHITVSQHHIVRPDDREKYTLQCLTAPHRTTRRQREVHITVSHSATSYDRATERCTHYSVSQHHIVLPDDRERYTLRCLTAPHRTTRRQREVHIKVSLSTTFYYPTTEKKNKKQQHTLQCLTERGQARTRDRRLQVFDALIFLPASTLKTRFQKFRTRECRFTCNA